MLGFKKNALADKWHSKYFSSIMNDYNIGISGTGKLLVKIAIMKLGLSHGKIKLTLLL